MESQSSQIPSEALSFNPEDEQIFFRIKTKKQRLIFEEPQEFEDEEKDRLKEFDMHLEGNSLKLPSEYTFRDIYRFLQAEHFDGKKTYDAIIEHKSFMEKHLPPNIDGLEKLHESGIFYICNRDKWFRPVIVLDLGKLLKSEMEEDDILRYTIYIIEWAIKNALVPGRVENWFVIIDWANLGFIKIPRGKMRKVINTMRNMYRGRLYRIAMINVSFMLRAILSAVHAFIDEFIAKKMFTYGSNYQEFLLAHIDKDKLEEKFGGTFSTMKNDFFPPSLG